eukprot:TRINITY_DN10368_c0_g1_i16.p2 TRINITY_DN10368_c0_g1~~TRINITY_DN10368_c0_g1_i16.p2  ORF type:complete len:134 (-),score=0.46 TRINITY_DN10368_c0_g1_i16:178-579(-)
MIQRLYNPTLTASTYPLSMSSSMTSRNTVMSWMMPLRSTPPLKITSNAAFSVSKASANTSSLSFIPPTMYIAKSGYDLNTTTYCSMFSISPMIMLFFTFRGLSSHLACLSENPLFKVKLLVNRSQTQIVILCQ